MVRLWFIPLEPVRGLATGLRDLLTSEELLRADRFRFAVDKDRFLIAHGALRILLGRYLDRSPETVSIQRGGHGKPFVDGSPIRFNLSDTKDAVLIGFTLDEEIGVDIETMSRMVDHAAVTKHYFTVPEEELINSLGKNGKRKFLELWTRKEAVLKASGVGIMDDLRVLKVDSATNEMTITHHDLVRMAAPEYHVLSIPHGPDHVISIATPSPIHRISLHDALPLIRK